jgi:hypothetical protein
VVHHVRVRELLERRNLSVREADADAVAADAGMLPMDDDQTAVGDGTGQPGALDVPLFPEWSLG